MPRRPLLIDFFCCEGGAAKGYHAAGWDVIGIDDKPQPRFPFAFIQCSYDKVDPRLIAMADALHGSPPCQFDSELTPIDKRGRHLNLIPGTRKLFRASGKPYTIENVRNVAKKHLIDPVSLTGTMFDMHMVTSKGVRFDLSRDRFFESNWTINVPWDPGPQHPIANVFGGHLRARGGEYRTGGKTGKTVDFPGEDRPALAKQLMEMPWATMGGMSEAVPPPFTEHIGTQLLMHLQNERVAA